MIGNYGVEHLDLFKATKGWALLNDEQQSIWVAYLRRSEVYALASVLTQIGAAIDVTALSPVTQPVETPAGLNSPRVTSAPAVSSHSALLAEVPPSYEELARLHTQWDKDWKRHASRASASSSSSSTSSAPVSLTRAETHQVTQAAMLRSQELSGHGRPAHGGYASSSSPSTLAADTRRSQSKAVERALEDALARKKKDGPQ